VTSAKTTTPNALFGGATYLTPTLSPLKGGEGDLETDATLTPSPPHRGGEVGNAPRVEAFFQLRCHARQAA